MPNGNCSYRPAYPGETEKIAASDPRLALLGNNTMHLNEASIIAAMQMFLDAVFREGCAPKVMSVTQVGNSNDNLFAVVLAERAERGK